LAKQEKLTSNSLAPPPLGNICTPIQVGIGVAKPGGRVKKEINTGKGFLMQVFKRWKDINIILFLCEGF
jgi:hypothetical protein